MKKIIIYTCIVLLFAVSVNSIYAISPTPTAVTPTTTSKTTPTVAPKDTPKSEDELNQIQKIKDLVAKKVSQLNLVEKRGIVGTVKEVSNTQITVEDRNDLQRIIDIDEITKFQENAGSSKTFGISDIKKGDKFAFIGLYNKDTKRLLARFVTRVNSIPERFEGVILEKDTKNFQLKVVNAKGTQRIIDNQNSTKIQIYDKDEIAKSGFSKIEPGQRVFSVGFQDTKDAKLFIPQRIIHFPDLPPSPDMMKYLTTQESPVSSGSGVKLQQLKK